MYFVPGKVSVAIFRPLGLWDSAILHSTVSFCLAPVFNLFITLPRIGRGTSPLPLPWKGGKLSRALYSKTRRPGLRLFARVAGSVETKIVDKDPELSAVSVSSSSQGSGGGGVSVIGEIYSAVLAVFGIRTEESSSATKSPDARVKKKREEEEMGTEDGAKGHPKGGKGGGKTTAVNAVKAAVGKSVNAVKIHAAGRKHPPRANKEESFDDAGGKPAKFVPTLMRALRLAKLYYFGDQKVRARVLLGAMLVLCGCTTSLMVVFSYIQRDMSTALSGKDVPGFYAAIRKYIGVIVVAAPLFAIYHYVQSLVALEWRL